MSEWTIAAVQYENRGSLAKNIAAHLQFIHAAAQQGCSALLFPELSLTGDTGGLPPSTSPLQLQPLVDAARRYQMTIVAGLPLCVQGENRTGVAIFSPSAAAPVTLYAGRSAGLTPGDRLTLHFPSNADSDASELDPQASLFATGTATCGCQQQRSVQQLQRLAHKYNIAVLKANEAGGSALWDESGQLIVRADVGELLLIGRKSDRGWEGDIIPLRECLAPIDEIACGA